MDTVSFPEGFGGINETPNVRRIRREPDAGLRARLAQTRREGFGFGGRAGGGGRGGLHGHQPALRHVARHEPPLRHHSGHSRGHRLHAHVGEGAEHGVFTVAGIVYGALFLAMGCFWFVVLCFVAASVVADAVMWPNPRSVTRMSVAYAVSVAGLSFGYNGAIVLMRDTFNEVMVKNGIPAEYSDALNAFVSDPMLAVLTAAAFLVALLGAYVGRRVLKKHFVRAGLVQA